MALAEFSGATGAADRVLSDRIDAVTLDEPVTGSGDKTSPDAQRVGDQVSVRSEGLRP